ncbi:MAG TPA: hypothetical protein PLB55_18725, partial [Prosthecobacter sp.]|nr:hypothetical protein [Prosthecobacter sp.]
MILRSPDHAVLTLAIEDVLEQTPPLDEQERRAVLRLCLQQARAEVVQPARQLMLLHIAAILVAHGLDILLEKEDLEFVVARLADVLRDPGPQADQRRREMAVASLALLGGQAVESMRSLTPTLAREDWPHYFSWLQKHPKIPLSTRRETADFITACLRNPPFPEVGMEVLPAIGSLAEFIPSVSQELVTQMPLHDADYQARALGVLTQMEEAGIVPRGTTLAQVKKLLTPKSPEIFLGAAIHAAGRLAGSWAEVLEFVPGLNEAAEVKMEIGPGHAEDPLLADLVLRLAARNALQPSDTFLKAALDSTVDLQTREAAVLFVVEAGRLKDKEFLRSVLAGLSDETFVFDRDLDLHSPRLKGRSAAVWNLDGDARGGQAALLLQETRNSDERTRCAAVELLLILQWLPAEATGDLQRLLLSDQLAFPVRCRLMRRLAQNSHLLSAFPLDWNKIIESAYQVLLVA